MVRWTGRRWEQKNNNKGTHNMHAKRKTSRIQVDLNVSWLKHINKEECIQPQNKINQYVKIRISLKIFFVFVCWTHKLRGIDELYKKKNTRTGNKKKHTISISSEVHVQTIYPLRSWSFPSFSPSVPITFLSAPTNNDKYINI